MSLRRLRLPDGVPGQVGWSHAGALRDLVRVQRGRARRAALSAVVCLAPRDELAELSPEYHAAIARGSLPFRWLHVPMRNFGLPEDPAAFRRDIAAIARSLHAGDVVLLHCAAGLGRTGSAAACLLKALGMGGRGPGARAGSRIEPAERGAVGAGALVLRRRGSLHNHGGEVPARRSISCCRPPGPALAAWAEIRRL